VARRILDQWEETLLKFVKVMPVDYKRALEIMAREQAGKAVAQASI
jgi:glutamate synthase domain-containing protein 3